MVTNHITLQGVTQVTDPSATRARTNETGHNHPRTLEDLGRVNLSTLAVAINLRHVTLDSNSSITIDKDLPTGYVKRSNKEAIPYTSARNLLAFPFIQVTF